MGFLKKIFKPVAKVLDKVIPNEIKPALPYLAAFAPYFGPTSNLLGQGIMRRSLLSGALNIGGQLAQEGNEGDINLLSAGLGALSGAMTAPGAADTFAGSRVVGTGADGKAITASEYAKLSEGANLGTGMVEAGGVTADLVPAVTSAPIQGPVPFSQVVPGGSSGITGLAKAKNLALTGLEGGSKFISEGMAGGLKDKAQVLAIPAAQATGDVMQAEARLLEKQNAIDEALRAAEALEDANMRGDAIRNAMRTYGFFSDEEIEDTVSSAGYRAGGRVGFTMGGDVMKAVNRGIDPAEALDILKEFKRMKERFGLEMGFEDYLSGEMFAKGGRVGFKFGGIDEAIEGVSEEIQEEGKEGIMMAAKEDPLLIEEYNKYVFDLLEQRPNAKPMSFSDFKRMIMSGMKEGGRVNLREGGVLSQILPQVQPFMGRPAFAPTLQQAQAVFPRLNQLEQGVNTAEQDLGRIRERLGDQPRQLMSASQAPIGLQPTNMLSIAQLANRGDVPQGMKEGGLMDLGGKEMDLRGGGFVPIGKKEKADDVPARLSKNEFVMTADAVRAAGGGSVNKGAKRMYDLMNNLEARV